MSKNDNDSFLDSPDNSEFSLEAILAEYKSFPPTEHETGADAAKERGRAIVMDALDHTIGAARISSVDELLAETEQELKPAPPAPPMEEASEFELQADLENELALTLELDAVTPEAPADLPEPDLTEISDTADRSVDYASADFPPPEPEPPAPRHQPPTKHSILSPIVSLLAMVAVRKQQRKTAEEQAPPPEPEADAPPEPKPAGAAKFYSRQVKPLKMRGTIALLLCLVLVYISYGLPVFGALRDNIRVQAMMCLVVELSVMLVGLDVITNGILSLCRRKPGMESLVAVSCVLSALDAVVLAITGNDALGLPFCAVSALSVFFAIWGARLTCTGYRCTFRALAMSKSPQVITAERGIEEGGSALLKSQISTKGFIRRSEGPDFGEESYSLFAPFLLIAAVVLSILASVVRGRPGDFFHTLSALTAACASFSALVAFPLPFSLTARRLLHSGAAVAGYAGISDIGESRRVVITDGDIFPPGTLSIDGIRILEGAYTDKVISYTGSVLAASGSGTAAVFTELMKRNGCTMQQVTDFAVHEGGGVTATVRNEAVYVGNTGFMNLMGIRLPRKLTAKNAIFTAISGVLVGIFTINYTPVTSVQEGLITLLRSRRYPIFAIRDFNVTPLLIRQKFKMPTEGFDFPSFAERYRISAAEPGAGSQIAAIVSRDGLGPMIEAADRGKKGYRAIRISVVLSLIGSILGMIFLFFLCWGASYDAATVGNMMSFMFLWLVPVLVISLGLNR